MSAEANARRRMDILQSTHDYEKWMAEHRHVVAADLRYTKKDAIPELEFNEIIWKAIRGANNPMPPPVHAAFVRPLSNKDRD